MSPLRNEVEETDQTDHAAKPPMGFAVTLIAGLHVLCCGLLLPLITGVSLATILPSLPVIGAIAVLLGIVGFIWFVRKGSATCPANPNRSTMERPHNKG